MNSNGTGTALRTGTPATASRAIAALADRECRCVRTICPFFTLASRESPGEVHLSPAMGTLLPASLQSTVGFPAAFTVLLAAGLRLRFVRRKSWDDLRLKYEEYPDPAIHALGLGR